MSGYGEPNPEKPKYTLINWSGKKYYKFNPHTNEVRSADWYDRGAIRCTSIRQIISEFGISGYTVMDWTVL